MDWLTKPTTVTKPVLQLNSRPIPTNKNNASRRRRKVVPATYRLSNSEANQAPPLPSLHWRCCLATAGRLALSLVAIATPCRAADTCKRMTNIHFSLAASPFHLSHPFLLLSPLLFPYPSMLPRDPSNSSGEHCTFLQWILGWKRIFLCFKHKKAVKSTIRNVWKLGLGLVLRVRRTHWTHCSGSLGAVTPTTPQKSAPVTTSKGSVVFAWSTTVAH